MASLIVAIVFVLIAIGFAVVRGASRSIFRIALVAISAIAAIILTLVLKAQVVSDMTLGEISQIDGAEGIAQLLSDISVYSPSLVKILAGSTVAFLAPLVFMVMFIAFTTVTWLLYFISTLILFPIFHGIEKKRKGKKLLSVILGAAQAVIVLFFVISPISYYAGVVEDTSAALEESGAADAIVDTFADVIADSLEKDPEAIKAELKSDNSEDKGFSIVSLNGTLGGRAFSNALASFKFVDTTGETVKVSIADEAAPMLEIAMNVVKLSGKPVEEFSEAEAAAIEAVGEKFSESPLVSTVSKELVHGLTEAWKNGDAYASIAKPELGDPTGDIFDKVIVIFNESSTSTEYLGTDVKDISKVVSVLVKAEVMKDMNNPEILLDKLSTGNTINDVTAILRTNPRLRQLIPDITTLSIYVLADTIGIPENKDEVYVNMLNDVAAMLNETRELDPVQRLEILQPFLKEEFQMVGAEVSDENIESISQALVTDFSEVEEVTPEFVSEFFAIYEINRGEIDGGVSDVVFNGNAGVTKLDGKNDMGFTFPKYQTEEGRAESGAAIVGKLDAEIIKISGSDRTDEEKREMLSGIVNELMAPVLNNIVEKSEDKEKSAQYVASYTENVLVLSIKEKETNIESSENIASFAASVTANINCLTLTDIKNKFSASTEITDEAEVEKHGEVINKVIGCASALLSATKKDEVAPPATDGGEGEAPAPEKDNSLELLKAATEGIGSIFDTLSETQLYGKDDTANLMQSILTSETVSNVLPLTKEEAENIIDKVKNDENVSYGSLMTGVSGMAELIISMTDGSCSEDSVKNLILGLDEHNIGAIMVIVTEKRFESMGIKGDRVEPTYNIMTTLLEQLAAVTEENVEREAKAVKKLIDVALEAKAEGTGLFGEQGRIGDPALFIEEVLASDAVCNTIAGTEADPFGVSEKVSEADKAMFEAACLAYVGTEDEETVISLAAILGIIID